MAQILPATRERPFRVLLAGQPFGFVKSVQITIIKPVREAEQFGAQTPRTDLLGAPFYQGVLTRCQLDVDSPFQETELEFLSDFALSIQAQGKTVQFSGCHWTQLVKSMEASGEYYDSMTFFASGKEVMTP